MRFPISSSASGRRSPRSGSRNVGRWSHHFTYAAQAVGPDRFEDLVAIAPPESPAWAIGSPYLPELLWVIGDEARPLAEALRDHHDDPGLLSVLLGWELSQAAKAGDHQTIARLYRELEQPQFASTIAWRNARKHDPDRPIAIGRPLPDFTAVRLDRAGETLTRADLADKAWVIHVWTTWCSPCVEELSALPELYRERPDPEAVEFLAIGLDEERALAEHTLAEHPLSWPSTWSEDGEALMRAWGFSGVPLTVLVDERGTVVHVWDGKASNRAIAKQLSLLASRP